LLTHKVRAQHLGVRGPLFLGVVTNWNEFKFYRNSKHELLQPTYVSLFGLVNIQRYGEPCTLDKERLWERVFAVVGDQLWCDGHHFRNPENFKLGSCGVRLVD